MQCEQGKYGQHSETRNERGEERERRGEEIESGRRDKERKNMRRTKLLNSKVDTIFDTILDEGGSRRFSKNSRIFSWAAKKTAKNKQRERKKKQR